MFEPVLAIPLASSLVALFVIIGWVFEWKRKSSTPRMTLRMMAVLGVGIGVLFIVIRPKIIREQSGLIAAYLTEGYANSTLDSLKKARPQLKIFADPTIETNYPKVASINALVASEGPIDSLFVIGFGLRASDQETNQPFNFIPSTPTGVVGMDFPKDLTVGDSAYMTLHTSLEKEELFTLISPDGQKDSVRVAGGVSTIAFKIQPKLAGTYLYKVTRLSDPETTVGQIPIRVHPKSFYKVLILNESPNFESRYLKNWLAKAGHAITVRNKVSKDKFRYEYINTAPIPFKQFANNYDLVIMDLGSLATLTGTRFRDLIQSIEQGTGLMLQADEKMVTNQSFQNWFNTKSVERSEIEFGMHKLPCLPYRFMSNRVHSAIIPASNSADIVVQKRIEGEGAIVASFITETYPLLLQGHEEVYNLYWQNLIRAAVSEQSPTTVWNINENLPVVDAPLNLGVTTPNLSPQVKANGNIVPLIQDINFKDEWAGEHWPRKSGWSEFLVSKDSTLIHWEYIHPTKSWQSIQHYQRGLATKNINQRKVSFVEHEQRVPLSMWFWYILVISSLSFLWFEPKI